MNQNLKVCARCQAGITLVGLSSVLSGEGSQTHVVSVPQMLLGMGLIIGSQARRCHAPCGCMPRQGCGRELQGSGRGKLAAAGFVACCELASHGKHVAPLSGAAGRVSADPMDALCLVCGAQRAASSPSPLLCGQLGLRALAQAVQAAQITFEDYFMADLAIAPLKIVGWEGVIGLVAMVAIMLPVVYALPGVDGEGVHEDTIDSLHVRPGGCEGSACFDRGLASLCCAAAHLSYLAYLKQWSDMPCAQRSPVIAMPACALRVCAAAGADGWRLEGAAAAAGHRHGSVAPL